MCIRDRGEILEKQVSMTAEQVRPQEAEAMQLAGQSADPAGTRAAVESIYARLAALEELPQRMSTLTGDQWADALVECDDIVKDLGDLVWPLRIEELFRDSS